MSEDRAERRKAIVRDTEAVGSVAVLHRRLLSLVSCNTIVMMVPASR